MPRRSTIKAAEPPADPDKSLREAIDRLHAKYVRYWEWQEKTKLPAKKWSEPWDPEFNLYFIAREAREDRDKTSASKELLSYLKAKPSRTAEQVEQPGEIRVVIQSYGSPSNSPGTGSSEA